ncbi:MAG: general secretion pathway protein GspK [Gammaproteobacteria bacterium]|nr:general secretion pathway protein GspK [Gammaproteobacteria bacterium]
MRLNAPRQQGFALIITLVFLSVMILGAGYFAVRVDQARELAALEQARAQAMIERHSALNAMLYRLTVVRSGMHGIGIDPTTVVRVDGTVYRDGESTLLQLQDQRGLINLHHLDQELLGRLLAQHGIPLEQRGRLIDTLLDYIDEDDFRRLQGAEKSDYEEASLPPPANRPLRTLQELQYVYGWQQLAQTDLPHEVTVTSTVAGINPNAASARVLACLPGVDSSVAQSLIRYREHTPLTPGVIGQLTGMSATQMQFRIFTFPSRSYRLTVGCQACGLPVDAYNLVLTPMSTDSPWYIESMAATTTKNGEGVVETAKPLPAIPPIEALPLNAFHL